jgi:hypothetical protein
LASRHQKGKRLEEVEAPHRLLIVLHLLIVVGGLLLLIIIGGGGKRMRGTDAKSSQLSRSQWGIGIMGGRVDRHVRELNKRLIPLTMNDLLVAVNNMNVLLHHIHAQICAAAHGEDTSEHLQETGVLRGGRGTTATGYVSMSDS